MPELSLCEANVPSIHELKRSPYRMEILKLAEQGIPCTPTARRDLNRAFRDAICLACGVQPPNMHPAAPRYARDRFMAMCEDYCTVWNPKRDWRGIRAINAAFSGSCMPDAVRLSYSTGDFGDIVTDAASVMAKVVGGNQQPDAAKWCRFADFPTLKARAGMIDVVGPLTEDIAPGADYPQLETIGSTDGVEWTITKRGLIFSLTREALINDAWGLIAGLVDSFRLIFSATIDYRVCKLLQSQSGLFSTANANITTGTLSITSLQTAISGLTQQKNGRGVPLGLRPKYLVVPTSLQTVAAQLLGSMLLPPFDNSQIQLVPMAFLDEGSAIQWYLTADPAQIDVGIVAFPFGEERVSIEREDKFSTDTTQYKIRVEGSPKFTDHRGIVRSSGA